MNRFIGLSLRITTALVFLTVSCSPKPSQPAVQPTAPTVPAVTQAGVAPQPAGAATQPAAAATEAGPVQAAVAWKLEVSAPTGNAADAARDLAAKLAQAKDADQAAPILAEVLVWAGIPIYDSNGQRLAAPVEPASELQLFDFQVYGLALDYMNQGGLTLDELSQALTEAETTVNDIPMTADLLENLFSNWTTSAAQADPSNWETFTPDFLRELNLIKDPAIDLQYTGYDANDLRLSGLELALLAAAHVRDGTPAPESLASFEGAYKLAAPHSDNVCAEWNKSQEAAFSKWGAGGTTWGVGEILGTAWDMATEAAGKVAGSAMKIFGKGFGWLLTAISTLAGATAWEFTISADPNPAHYKHNQQNDVTADFVAHIKVNEKWPKWFADCLKSIGTEMPSNDNLSDNIIHWYPIHNLPPHADIDPEGQNGRMEQHFTSSGEARLKVLMWQEKDGDWETAPEKHDHMTVRGELYRNNDMPGAETLIEAASGNIPAAIIPVLTKWYDKWFPKKAWGVMNVDYHKIVPMVFTQSGEAEGIHWTATGYNCQGIYGSWTVELSGGGNSQGMVLVIDGNLSGTLPKEGEGTISGSESFDAIVSTAPINANLDFSVSGKLNVSGTKDAPVLVFKWDQASGSATGQAPNAKISMPLQGPGGAPFGVVIKPDPEFAKCK
ncbi:MAG: hypothetical protein M1281_00075 [Chloroflexi bacterium]|nr:hypothetical protein [Chloroflexota bacterium]